MCGWKEVGVGIVRVLRLRGLKGWYLNLVEGVVECLKWGVVVELTFSHFFWCFHGRLVARIFLALVNLSSFTFLLQI